MAELEIAAAAAVAVGTDAPAPQVVTHHCVPSRVGEEITSYNATASPATYEFVGFPSPKAGRIWEIMRLSVWPTDPFTAITPDVLAYIGTYVPAPNSTEPPISSLEVVPAAPPYVVNWSRRQLIIQAHQRLILCGKSLTSSDSFSASILVIDHDVEEFLYHLAN